MTAPTPKLCAWCESRPTTSAASTLCRGCLDAKARADRGEPKPAYKRASAFAESDWAADPPDEEGEW